MPTGWYTKTEQSLYEFIKADRDNVRKLSVVCFFLLDIHYNFFS